MTEEAKVNYVDHISIAVMDLKKAEEDFKNNFGWKVAGRYKDLDEKISVVYFQVGPTAVEIMEDIDGTGEVAKFIKKRGEGVMVLSFNVDNCLSSLEILKKNGTHMIDKEPRYAKELNRYFAFIHPKVCHGILTEVIDGKY
ncbi:VOC family protein [Thermodesulfobacteriota bacterium]